MNSETCVKNPIYITTFTTANHCSEPLSFFFSFFFGGRRGQWDKVSRFDSMHGTTAPFGIHFPVYTVWRVYSIEGSFLYILLILYLVHDSGSHTLVNNERGVFIIKHTMGGRTNKQV